jgi:beta-phosphoglucomutase
LILERVGIGSLFDAVVDGAKIRQAKPDPEVFLCAARDLGVPPPGCVVFEEAGAGIEAAHRAGMGAVGVGQAAALKDADVVVRGLDQLMALTQF